MTYTQAARIAFEGAILRAFGLEGRRVVSIDVHMEGHKPATVTIVEWVGDQPEFERVVRTFEMATFTETTEAQPSGG